MSKPTDEYWIERATRREERTSKFTDDLVRQVRAMHDRAQNDIEEEIRTIIRTYRRKGLLSQEEAQKILNTVESSETLKELRDTLQDVEDSDARRELLNRINAPAYRHRLTRLQAMQDRIDAECTRLASQTIVREREAFITVIQEEFNRHLFDIEKGTSISLDFTGISSEVVEEAINHSWHGKDYADSVWENTREVAKSAKDIVQAGMLSGRSVAKMTAQLRERFQTAKYKAERVIRTEMNYLHNQADLQVYKQLGTERYRFLATLDSTTCKKCGALDNKMFLVSEAMVGQNYPPLHPNDRCTTVPVIEGEDISKGKRRYRDPITGKNGGLVSANMTYEQWAALQDAKHGAGTIDKLRRMAYNRSADKTQFDAYKSRLGADAPKKFAEFQQIKYNDLKQYEDLVGYYRYKGENPESGHSFYEANKAVKVLRSAGSIRATGTIVAPPKNVSVISANDHTQKRMTERNISLEQAKSFIDHADFAIKQRNGMLHAYYTGEGFAALYTDGTLATVAYLDESGKILYDEVMVHVKDSEL